MNSLGAAISRAICRSARNGEMNEHEHDQAGIDHQLGHLADAADVLDPVGVGEAEIAVEAVADVVAVEQHRCGGRARCSFCSTRLAMVDLPEPGQAGEPQHRRLLALQLGARCGLSTEQRLPVDVGGAAQRESDHAGADGRVGEAVDQDEGAGVAVLAHRDRRRPARWSTRLQKPISFSAERASRRDARSVLTSMLVLERR